MYFFQQFLLKYAKYDSDLNDYIPTLSVSIKNNSACFCLQENKLFSIFLLFFFYQEKLKTAVEV